MRLHNVKIINRDINLQDPRKKYWTREICFLSKDALLKNLPSPANKMKISKYMNTVTPYIELKSSNVKKN